MMKGPLKVPDRGRLLVEVLGPNDSTDPVGSPHGHIQAVRVEPDPYDLSPFQRTGLDLTGVTPEGDRIRTVHIPEGCIFSGARQRLAACYLATLLWKYSRG